MNRWKDRRSMEELIAKTEPVKSLADFDAEVRRFADAWHDDRPKLWFRGQASANDLLIPPALRDAAVARQLGCPYDMHTFIEFKRRGIGLVQPEPKTDWGWLYVAQHHGLPTRLLDWTEGSHIALFFAVAARPTETFGKACVWVLNAGALNKANWGFSNLVVLSTEHPETDVLLNPYRNGTPPKKNDGTDQHVLALIPEYVTPRLRAQRGAFVAFANDPDALNRSVVADAESTKPVCRPIVIDGDFVQKIEGELSDAGISHSVIFPDVDGLCTELARRGLTGKH